MTSNLRHGKRRVARKDHKFLSETEQLHTDEVGDCNSKNSYYYNFGTTRNTFSWVISPPERIV